MSRITRRRGGPRSPARSCAAPGPAGPAARSPASVLGRDVEFEHGRVLALDLFDADRVRVVDELAREPGEEVGMSELVDSCGLDQLRDRVGGLRALAEPILHLRLVELDRRRLRLQVVAPDDLDEAAVARRRWSATTTR